MASKWQNIMNIKWCKRVGGTLLAATALSGIAVSLSVTPAYATELTIHPPKLPWYHENTFSSYDHNSLRRGYQVFREVCSACHGLKFVFYRHLVDVCVTEDEAKKYAAEMTVLDGPNNDGEMFERPGKLIDRIQSPYPNTEAAKKANNGAFPRDLSYIVLARHGREDYIFHILTGYCDPPAGRILSEGTYYNPYFPGGAISMARALYTDMIEYEDGTPATASQMAKDVTTFLRWAADPNLDTRKRYVAKGIILLTVAFVTSLYLKRTKWSYLKTMQFAYKNRKPPKDI